MAVVVSSEARSWTLDGRGLRGLVVVRQFCFGLPWLELFSDLAANWGVGASINRGLVP